MKIAINPNLDEKVSFTLTLREWRALVERSTENADPRYAEPLKAAYRVINGYLMERGI